MFAALKCRIVISPAFGRPKKNPLYLYNYMWFALAHAKATIDAKCMEHVVKRGKREIAREEQKAWHHKAM